MSNILTRQIYEVLRDGGSSFGNDDYSLRVLSFFILQNKSIYTQKSYELIMESFLILKHSKNLLKIKKKKKRVKIKFGNA